MLKKKIKVVHLTSVHPRYDTRVFIRMCQSLASSGYDVYLVVADGKGNERIKGVSIIDVGRKEQKRLMRMTKTVKKVFEKAMEIDGDVYHLHDAELLTIALKLKKLKKKVIFDSHEDLPKQLLSKPYIGKIFRIVLSVIIDLYQRFVIKRIDGAIAAPPLVEKRFLKINPNSKQINNFPITNELSNSTNWNTKKNEIAYVGNISEIRGIIKIFSALSFTSNVRFNLVGNFNNKILEKNIKNHKNWSKTNYFGFLNREKVREILSRSKVGIVTFLPEPDHINSQPNKLFEYMSAGIPVVASKFTLWQEIVENNSCGICVNPLDSKEIGDAIQYLLDNPIESEKMGKNGLNSIKKKYNWESEFGNLLSFYHNIIDKNHDLKALN